MIAGAETVDWELEVATMGPDAKAKGAAEVEVVEEHSWRQK